jgi:hypothetical protein
VDGGFAAAGELQGAERGEEGALHTQQQNLDNTLVSCGSGKKERKIIYLINNSLHN